MSDRYLKLGVGRVVEFDEDTEALFQYLATANRTTPTEVLGTIIRTRIARLHERERRAVPVYLPHASRRVEGRLVVGPGHLIVTSAPWNGVQYRSPSVAAAVVRAALDRLHPQPDVDGWDEWRVALTDAPARILRDVNVPGELL